MVPPIQEKMILRLLAHISAIPIILYFTFLAATSAMAGLPAQKDIFTIASFTPSKGNYVSADYIYSALPLYEEVSDPDSLSDYPSHKKADTQQGAIVLRDKTVLFFDTRSPKYLSVVDPSNHSMFYRLTKTLPARRKCPVPPPDLDALPFPQPAEVFCVATFPWNPIKHFTPQSLVEALPRLRASQEYPQEWIAASRDWVHRTHQNPALNGVLVLTNRAVLKWFAWSPHAIRFENYREKTYYLLEQ